MPKIRTLITHRELQLGDTISLDFAELGWDRAKVVAENETMWQLFRPWMPPGGNGYPTIQIEMFWIYKDSDKTVLLIDRGM